MSTALLEAPATLPPWHADNAGMRLYDGTATDYGAGPGITTRLRSTDGSAFFSGVVSASSIVSNSPAGMPSMTINMVSTPQMVVNDGVRDRVQIGAIPGPDYGFLVNDASGSPILDSIGLRQVMISLGGRGLSSSGSFTPPAGWSAVPFTNQTISVARTTTVFALAVIDACCSVGDYTTWQLRNATNGNGSASVYNLWGTGVPPNAVFHSTMFWILESLPAGTYTYQIQVLQPSSLVCWLDNGAIQVFSLGK